jgi:hypothetical protein
MWDEPNEYKMYEGLYIPREQLNEEQRTTANRADSLYRASADDFETEKYKLSPYIN